MTTMSVSELRANLKKALARVEAGEVIEVTRDGETAAVIVHPSQVRLRARSDALAMAEEIHQRMEAARSRPFRMKLEDGEGFTPEEAEELVREIRRQRDRGR